MRLICVADLDRELCKICIPLTRAGPSQKALESQHLLQCLGPVAHGRIKPASQLTFADAEGAN
jgi:hypothetical protein